MMSRRLHSRRSRHTTQPPRRTCRYIYGSRVKLARVTAIPRSVQRRAQLLVRWMVTKIERQSVAVERSVVPLASHSHLLSQETASGRPGAIDSAMTCPTCPALPLLGPGTTSGPTSRIAPAPQRHSKPRAWAALNSLLKSVLTYPI
jgi:hypothetical protein